MMRVGQECPTRRILNCVTPICNIQTTSGKNCKKSSGKHCRGNHGRSPVKKTGCPDRIIVIKDSIHNFRRRNAQAVCRPNRWNATRYPTGKVAAKIYFLLNEGKNKPAVLTATASESGH